ncbi:exodeoxyribonuclease III [Rhodovulum sp. DZ06]|uniref:exodeoxyribonuclease III n=1 Tax=Rhodovulum sp. DZ06 TaxID=3425126 RepID=UPI003D33B3B6
MAFTICTWNINSVRLRADLVAALLREEKPDVLCLQETKSPVDKIPFPIFEQLGWKYAQARGEKGYNGVAILSRIPLEPVEHVDWVGKGDARHVAARLPGGEVVHNLYVPAGGDEPDVATNPKFDHKLKFVDQMAAHFEGQDGEAVLVGDLNIAPGEDDVWSHKQLLKVVSHTPIEVEKFEAARARGGWEDVVRKHLPEGKLYSWWSYRARDWDAADKGRRLDHVWATPGLAARSQSARILREARGWEKPSDHAPVFVTFGE